MKHINRKQARKTRSYASWKLCRPTDLLTGVKCRATSVAKNYARVKCIDFLQMQSQPWDNNIGDTRSPKTNCSLVFFCPCVTKRPQLLRYPNILIHRIMSCIDYVSHATSCGLSSQRAQRTKSTRIWAAIGRQTSSMLKYVGEY